MREPRSQTTSWCAKRCSRSLVKERRIPTFPPSVATEPSSFLPSRPDKLEVNEDGLDRLASGQRWLPREENSSSFLDVEVAALDERVFPGVTHGRQQTCTTVEDDGPRHTIEARRERRPSHGGLTIREDPGHNVGQRATDQHPGFSNQPHTIHNENLSSDIHWSRAW